MINSMTGYGGAKGENGGISVGVELKSVNNRYLDVSVRLPRNFLFAEEMIKSAVASYITRGKVDVYVSIDASGSDTVEVVVNRSLAKSYINAIRSISDDFSLPIGMDAVSVGRFTDVLSLEKKELDKSVVSEGISAVIEQALTEFDEMRMREGSRLCEDISARLETIEKLVSVVEERSPLTVEEYRRKLTAKLNEVLENKAVDEQRILTEAAIFADKIAVDEETVRLRSHISQMRGMLSSGSPIGRKMGFLIQEFNREANTIGSKCSDAEISKVVVDIKAEIEKIREQIQNIE